MAFDTGSRGRGIRPSMNVTPLVDVVLVLLIIFMVVTPMLQKQVWMHVPPKSDAAPIADSAPPLVLSVTAAGLISVNGTEIPRSELAQRVQGLVDGRPDKIVFFDAAETLPYEEAVAVLDLLKGQKIEDVAVLAEPLTP